MLALGWALLVTRRGRRVSRPWLGRALRFLAAALVLFAVGATVESMGAFGYDGDARVNAVAGLHTVGLTLSLLGLLATLAGVVAFAALAALLAVRRQSQ